MTAPQPVPPAGRGSNGRRLIVSGLLAGLLVNAIDIPNSAILVSPAWTATYAAFRARFGPGTRTALAATGLRLAVHRGFPGGAAGARLYERLRA
jgi:hypothetical protein